MYERHIEANDNILPQEMYTILSALYAAWCSETCRLCKKKRTLFGLSTLSISNSDIYKSLTVSLGHIISSTVDEPYSERTDLNYAIHLAALIANLDKVLRMLQIYWKKYMCPRKNAENILWYSKTDCSSQLQGSLLVYRVYSAAPFIIIDSLTDVHMVCTCSSVDERPVLDTSWVISL